MIVLDASILIAALSSHDAHHDVAISILRAQAHDGFLVHPMTLAEVLVGPVRLGRGAQAMADLEGIGVQVHQSGRDEPLLLAELRATTRLKLPDCCVLVAAQHASLPLATCDDRLAAEARALGLQLIA